LRLNQQHRHKWRFINPLNTNQQPRPKGTRYVVLIRYLYEGFNTILSALKGEVLTPSTRIKDILNKILVKINKKYDKLGYIVISPDG